MPLLYAMPAPTGIAFFLISVSWFTTNRLFKYYLVFIETVRYSVDVAYNLQDVR